MKIYEAWEDLKQWVTMSPVDTFYQDELLDKIEELECKHE